jgi:DNA-binding winged helix-turn-helix (wHTH) protein
LADKLSQTHSEKIISENQIRQAIYEIKKSLGLMGISFPKVISQSYGLGYKLNHQNIHIKIRQ